MSQDTDGVIVTVPVPRRLLWEMRTRYDEATVGDLLRLVYCGQIELAYRTLCGAVIGSYAAVSLLAVAMPGPVVAQWPMLVPIGVLAAVAYVRAYRKMAPYSRARQAIQNADIEKFKRIAEELAPLAKEYLTSQREDATVSLRL